MDLGEGDRQTVLRQIILAYTIGKEWSGLSAPFNLDMKRAQKSVFIFALRLLGSDIDCREYEDNLTC